MQNIPLILILLRNILTSIKGLVSDFITGHKIGSHDDKSEEFKVDIQRISSEKVQFEGQLSESVEDEKRLAASYESIKREIEQEKTRNVEAEKEMLRIMSRQSEFRSKLDSIRNREERLSLEEGDFQRELHEAALIGGREAISYSDFILQEVGEERQAQLDRRRMVEKIKIRLEEAGASLGEDVMKEFKETEERDQFLARELEDLNQVIG